MEGAKRLETDEIRLPEPIIQHIQSFLDAKQAAQTSILCKSWCNAWLTRPIVDLDELNFVTRGDDQENENAERFSEYAKKTMQRYKDSKLKIERFRLRMIRRSNRKPLADELIAKAVEMGVSDFHFELDRRDHDMIFVLPHEVLESENLIRLSVHGCAIDVRADGKISCSRLKSLSINECVVNDTVWDIISSCPMIEELLLWDCLCLVEVDTDETDCDIWTWRTPSIASSEFHRLNYLSLYNIAIDGLFFHDFSRKFPCLENLGIYECDGYEEMGISSHSLKCISLSHVMILNAHLDVPSMIKFEYTGPIIHSLSFANAPEEWESGMLIISGDSHVSPEWFYKLKNLLKILSQSKISLDVDFFESQHIDFGGQFELGLPGVIVENLSVAVHTQQGVCSALLNGLFWSCRPKSLRQYWFAESDLFPHSNVPENINKDFLEFLCKRLLPELSQNCCFVDQNLSGLHHLEEYVEVFEHTEAGLQPVPWKSFLDASTGSENAYEICFRLKWDSPDHAQESNIPSCERVL